jgi:endonuclease YncB( thermonuclease family)
VINFPWGALVRRGLVPAWGHPQGAPLQQGARAAYQDFLTFWRDADPDIPMLKEAKAEYAALR